MRNCRIQLTNYIQKVHDMDMHINVVKTTRSSADADNGLDAFVGQSRSKSILNPFQVK